MKLSYPILILGLLLNMVSYQSAKALSPDETAIKILEESPQFALSVLSLESARAELASSANLPDLQLEGEFLAAPPDEPDRWGAELSWGLEWPGVYKARRERARLQGNALEEAQINMQLQSLWEIKSLLLDYILQKNKINIIDGLGNSNDSIYYYAEHAAKGGELSKLDLNKIKIEKANLRASRASMADELSSTVARLSEIYGKDCSELLENMDCVFPPVAIPDADTLLGGIANYAGVKAAGKQHEAALSEEKVARMEALPGISFGYKHAYEDGTHFNGATLGLTIPGFSQRHKKAAAKAAIAEAEFAVQKAQTDARTEIEMEIKRLEIMKSQIDEIEPLVTSSENSALLLKAYENGVITLLDYLTERNYYTAALVQLLDLRYAAAQSILTLAKYK